MANPTIEKARSKAGLKNNEGDNADSVSGFGRWFEQSLQMSEGLTTRLEFLASVFPVVQHLPRAANIVVPDPVFHVHIKTSI
jgi:hypothetical protein